jgi:hypothetical protein
MTIFSRLKGKFARAYEGRYMGCVLEQVVQAEPQMLKALFPALAQRKDWGAICKALRSGERDSQITVEVPFEGKYQNRRADLAIEYRGELIALLEIKYEDHRSQTNRAQLQDNIAFVTQSVACFTYLTLHQPPELQTKTIEQAKTKRVRHILYRGLYTAAEKLRKSNPVVDWFCQFLEEEFIVYQEKIGGSKGRKTLALLTRSILGTKTKGYGRLQGEERLTDALALFSELKTNAQTLSDWLRLQKGISKFLPSRPNVYFNAWPEYNEKAYLKEIDKTREIRRKYPKSKRENPSIYEFQTDGYLTVASSGQFPKTAVTKYLGLEIGYSARLWKTKRRSRVTLAIYFSIYGSDWEDYDHYCDHKIHIKNGSIVMSEANAQHRLLASIKEALTYAIDDKDTSTKNRNYLIRFKKAVEGIPNTAMIPERRRTKAKK